MADIDRSQLVGSWKLFSATGKMTDTGESVDLLGPDPSGYCMFDTDGRWIVVTSASELSALTNDAERAEWFGHRTVAFSGQFELHGDRIIVKIDVSWNPAMVGVEMPRIVEIQADQMTIKQPEWEHPFFPRRNMVGIVVWQREKKSTPIGSPRGG